MCVTRGERSLCLLKKFVWRIFAQEFSTPLAFFLSGGRTAVRPFACVASTFISTCAFRFNCYIEVHLVLWTVSYKVLQLPHFVRERASFFRENFRRDSIAETRLLFYSPGETTLYRIFKLLLNKFEGKYNRFSTLNVKLLLNFSFVKSFRLSDRNMSLLIVSYNCAIVIVTWRFHFIISQLSILSSLRVKNNFLRVSIISRPI